MSARAPDDAEILALHRAITAIPSVSGSEARLAEFLQTWLARHGAPARRMGDSLLALRGEGEGEGEGPVLLLDTHLDTVPAVPGWTRAPHEVAVVEGRVHGLGSNDAKASVAAMVAAFLAWCPESGTPGPPITVALGLAAGEETTGHGTEAILRALEDEGRRPAAAVVGEPTGLDVAVAQKGLLILELVARGDACHAAHGRASGARNAIAGLARDLVALEEGELAPPHPVLGPTTLEPTLIRGGSARNCVPGEASAVLDLRTTPTAGHDELAGRIDAMVASEVRVLSRRLEPREIAPGETIVRAALDARPAARLYGSRTMSDLARLPGVPGIKCGPGRTERSHTPDEFVLEGEILEGARFYTALIRAFAAARHDEEEPQ